ncbi:unnamed protein product [marine sediment metagenome]|uniref:HTH cro/C1-type domain-containing protein n=1 Tax=marine sediment metagenome TaxID=412755 RepID=X0RLB3_9ZZZZ
MAALSLRLVVWGQCESFREKIRREAKRRGWSGYRLGQESGVPIRTVQQYLRGACDLSGERLAKLCKALGLELKSRRRKGR